MNPAGSAKAEDGVRPLPQAVECEATSTGSREAFPESVVI
jgi:hypothetical protein